MKAIGWYYELAHAINSQTGEYKNWNKYISFRKPSVPKGSIRNLKRLYIKNDNSRTTSR